MRATTGFRNVFVLLAGFFLGLTIQAADPLRVFIRGGVKTHGPNQHDHPRFLGEWTTLLGERGVKVDGGMTFPSANQLAATDVVIIYAADGMNITGADRTHFEGFLRRGGGVVVLHDGVVAADQNEWCKSIIGGTWIWEKSAPGHTQTRWHEGDVGLFFVDQEHPITRGVSNFDWKDEVYNQLEMLPDVHVLAHSFIDVFNIWPQLWTYERTLQDGTAPYRAFVSIPGHEYDVFKTPHYRALLLRGIAWAGKRANADEFCRPEELGSLKYPAGGPRKATEAVAEMKLHPEFQVKLTADENVAEKIMSLDWDPQGRLWVVETPEYPGGRDVNKNDFKAYWNRLQDPAKYPVGGKMDRQPKDRISILTDTNGDGVMDQKTVFADGLELPTSLVFYKDGVIVSQAPDILWIRDTNGDGKADKMEVLYTGWGTFDTHAVINNLKWGMDGWIYGTVGYTRGDVRSGDGSRKFGQISAGAYRFRPDGSAVEQVSANGCNTWGLEITPDNEVIYTTATCGTPILHVVLPEKYLARGNVGGHPAWENVIEKNVIFPPFKEKRQPYVQIDWVDQWTAAAGALVYDGGAWPAKWGAEERYSFFMSEATMHLFHHQFLDWNGATLKGHKEDGRQETEFLTGGNDYWFRPIHARVGPDGAVYVVDFYNQIAVHNDTRGPAHGARNAAARPDRDHHFTRLWRVQHQEAKSLPTWSLNVQNPAGLVEMLSHPNGWVRGTANRLLTENPEALNTVQEALGQLIGNTSASIFGRVQALWLYQTLARTHDVEWSAEVARAVYSDASPAVRKNAIRVAAEFASDASLNSHLRSDGDSPNDVTREAVIAQLKDSNERVRMYALMAAGELPASRALTRAVVEAWPSLKNRWLQSAAVGAAAKEPLRYLEAAFQAPDPAFLADFIPHVTRVLANRGDGAEVGRLLAFLAGQPASADGLKAAVLNSLQANLAAGVRPALDEALVASMRALLAGERTAGSMLPLVARFEAAGRLTAEMKPAIGKAAQALQDPSLSDDVRGQVAANLMGIRSTDASVVPAVARLLSSAGNSEALRKRIVDILGNTPEGGRALVEVFGQLPVNLGEPAFGHIVKRAETANALVDQLAAKTLPLTLLGPARMHRLRTHGDQNVSRRANEVIDSLAGPEAKEKEALVSRYRPEVVKPGDVAKGKALYTVNCAGCHQYKDEGRNLAPNLNGMGAHGPEDLLIHILDPNRVVEANFLAYAIETKDGSSYNGVIERENASELVLRDAAADHVLRVSDIASKSSTGRSLMPEGFESLGADGLRDLLAYLCVDESRFRLIDLTRAFTASNSRGLFISPENVDETVTFNRYGLRRVEDVPFDVISPEKAVANVIVLKGGDRNSWSRRELPQRVEAKVGVAARRLHFLGGVAGWGAPLNEGANAARVTVHYADGAKQELLLKNGVEFADYNGRHNVPGSKPINWTVGRGQVRWFTKELNQRGVIDRLVFESYDNGVAPMFFAVTTDASDTSLLPGAAAPTVPAVPNLQWGNGLKTLIVGGGSSHDFNRFFGLADTATLNASGRITANYLEPLPGLAPLMHASDVLLLSNNQSFADDASRAAVFAHVNAGKGLVLVHPSLWYNWQKEWPQYNRELVGGGSRGHDRYGEFEVTVTEPNHPLLQGVPAKFTLSDELYYLEPDPAGTPIRVLATAYSAAKNKTYPQVYVVEHPKTRIAAITLGHDGVAHSHPAYQRLLKNAVLWTAKQDPASAK